MRDTSKTFRRSGAALPSREALASAAREMAGVFPFVEAVYLFGSLARGTARPSSDIDLAVLPSPPTPLEDRVPLEGSMARFVEDRLGWPVDVIMIHPGLSLPLLFDIFSWQTILFAHDLEHAHEAACRGRAAFREELPRLERQFQRVRERLTEHANALNPTRAGIAPAAEDVSLPPEQKPEL